MNLQRRKVEDKSDMQLDFLDAPESRRQERLLKEKEEKLIPRELEAAVMKLCLRMIRKTRNKWTTLMSMTARMIQMLCMT